MKEIITYKMSYKGELMYRELRQRILPDLKIDRIEYFKLQKSRKPDMDAGSVRLDVYVKDNKNACWVERA